MSKVAGHCALVVVSPVPWFPLQGLIRKLHPGYRPQPDLVEEQNGITVYFPRFLALPGIGRALDGFFMAICSLPVLLKLKNKSAVNLIDAHFAYPDGYAASWLGLWLKLPVTITLRGTELPLSKIPARRRRMLSALARAARVFSVSESLKTHLVGLGADTNKIRVVGNGVDTTKFFPIDKAQARKALNIAADAQVLISVGGLVDRKGFHRVLEILPDLKNNHSRLLYLIVGGASPEGDIKARLVAQVEALGLTADVRFLGAMASDRLYQVLSAADVFVLATANEGWANVFLEAMACGLPVVTTDVGGNREVVCSSDLGIVVRFGDRQALQDAVDAALAANWNREAIIEYARQNSWDGRVEILLSEFNNLVNV
ncbi:glycosyltransferase [Methylomonas sp. EFPC3]|uniref:glycosyltransferase n=1 Tax=Methylomonas sp. EFPC3 TaxID=3021710 RepID=UPI002417394C|nr:glycosyltransferase [Methylomonas sp. EFPC3]WFP50725.1 glycosyltransferase [Methylomonas sp. EFPC3]